jgi:hypothetical protein
VLAHSAVGCMALRVRDTFRRHERTGMVIDARIDNGEIARSVVRSVHRILHHIWWMAGPDDRLWSRIIEVLDRPHWAIHCGVLEG